VRITVQLVDVANDRSLWAKSYERSLTDIVALQSEVAHAIASEIRIQVTPEERARLRSKGTVNPAAHVAYLQGSFLWNRFTGGSVKEAILRYEEALAIDPNYAAACAGLAGAPAEAIEAAKGTAMNPAVQDAFAHAIGCRRPRPRVSRYSQS
jgi:hypothetical protein